MRFEACSGYLQLDSNKNTREETNFLFYSNMWVNGEYFKRVFLNISTDQSLLVNINQEFTHIWADGTSGKVPAIKTYFRDCYYADNGLILSA